LLCVGLIYAQTATPAVANSYCAGTVRLSNLTGVLSDHTGPGNYKDNSFCIWYISPVSSIGPVSFIKVNLSKLDIEYQFDVLFFFDGPTLDAPQLAWYTGTTPPRDPLYTTGPYLTVVFYSDELVNGKGFTLDYTAYNCPNGCSKHGNCLNGVCACTTGWSGTDCSTPYCVNACYPPRGT